MAREQGAAARRRSGAVIVETLEDPLAALLRATSCPVLDARGLLQLAGAPAPVAAETPFATFARWALAEVRAGRVARWALIAGAETTRMRRSVPAAGGVFCVQPMDFLEWLRSQRELATAHPSIGAYLAASDPDHLFEQLPTPFGRVAHGASGGSRDLVACVARLEWEETDSGKLLVAGELAGGLRWEPGAAHTSKCHRRR